MAYLSRENILAGKIKRLEANGVEVGPPAASLQEQFITEEIGKPGVAGNIFVLKDARGWQYLPRIHNDCAARNVL
jgi:hypothetical protein